MNKFKQKIALVLIIALCFSACFFISCGEDITVEDGEYMTELVAQGGAISSYVTGFKIEIKNNELIERDINFGKLTNGKVYKRNWMNPMLYQTYNGFDLEKLKKVNVCVKTDYLDDGELYYCLLKNEGNTFLILAGGIDGNACFLKIWLLKKIPSLDESEVNKHNLTKVKYNVEIRLFYFDLNYKYTVPGNFLSYNYLWDGVRYDGDSDSTDLQERETYTFLTDYHEKEDGYYLVYLTKNRIAEVSEKLKEYETAYANKPEYHFSAYDDDKIIDGKYLFSCRWLMYGITAAEAKFLKAEKLEDVPLVIGEYKLVLCAERKTATIKQNVTTGEELGKEIALYKKTVLKFESENGKPSEYLFETDEGVLQKITDENFALTGELLEAYSSSFANREYAYFPMIDDRVTHRVKTVTENGKKYVDLPYYEYIGNESRLFGGHTQEFENAFYKRVDENSIDALFDYDAVAEIIKTKK